MSLLNRLGLNRKTRRIDGRENAVDDARALEELLFSAAVADMRQPAGQKTSAPPLRKPVRAKAKKRDNGDIVIGAMGLALGLTCALFPWYIFFNPEQFGVREFVFSGGRSGKEPEQIAYQPARVGKPFAASDIPAMQLDFIPTATVPAADQRQQPRSSSELEQPFPADLVTFELVHVANGRAMIQDKDGLWIVQPGSRLPDASKVASIEQRKGRWVLVTTLDKIVELRD